MSFKFVFKINPFFLQLSKSNVFSSTIASVGKWFCFKRKRNKGENDHNITMEIKVTDGIEGDANTTVIECVNDMKWDTPRKPKPIIQQNNEKFTVTTKGNWYYVMKWKWFFNHLFSLTAPTQTASPQNELNSVLSTLARQIEEFQSYLALSKKQRKLLKPEFLSNHQVFLNEVIQKLRVLNVPKPNSISVSNAYYQHHSSTPYRSDDIRKPLAFSIGSQSTDTSKLHWRKWEHFRLFSLPAILNECMISVYRAKSDKVYLEDNRSDYTLVDVSTLPRSNSRSVHVAVKSKMVRHFIIKAMIHLYFHRSHICSHYYSVQSTWLDVYHIFFLYWINFSICLPLCRMCAPVCVDVAPLQILCHKMLSKLKWRISNSCSAKSKSFWMV